MSQYEEDLHLIWGEQVSLLQVKDVTHHYTARKLFKWKAPSKQVLSNVSFSIEEGACLGMIGPSGAGKSTLGKVMLGLERPQSGQIFFKVMIYIKPSNPSGGKSAATFKLFFKTHILPSTRE